MFSITTSEQTPVFRISRGEPREPTNPAVRTLSIYLHVGGPPGLEGYSSVARAPELEEAGQADPTLGRSWGAQGGWGQLTILTAVVALGLSTPAKLSAACAALSGGLVGRSCPHPSLLGVWVLAHFDAGLALRVQNEPADLIALRVADVLQGPLYGEHVDHVLLQSRQRQLHTLPESS